MQRRGITAILAALGLYGLAFIWNTSFIVEGKRYFCLFDDAMISMRYAKNFAAGNGLVWNPGEYVEGFTNLLWTLYMSAWHLLPIEARFMSLPIQLTSLVVLLLAAKLTYDIAGRVITNPIFRLLATAFSAFYFPSITWSLLGMEVGIVTLGLLVAVKWTLDAKDSEGPPIKIYVLLGALTLVRFDAVIFFIAISAYSIWHQPEARLRHILLLATMLVIFIGGQTLWRYSYYGELFPNTYYLKATGYPMYLRMSRGLYVLYHFLQQPNLLISLAPLAFYMWKRSRETNLYLAVIGVAMFYSVYVGGDAWEADGGSNRYITPVMPLYFVLLWRLISQCWEWLKEHVSNNYRLTSRLVAGVAVVILYLGFNTPTISAVRPHSLEDLLLLGNKHSGRYLRIQHARWIQQHTTADATVAVTWAGITPYFVDRVFIDLYGKADKYIARTAARDWKGTYKLLAFSPGHNKWDYDYSIGKLKPDIIDQLSEMDEVPVAHLQSYRHLSYGGISLYVRTDTKSVLQ